MQMIPAVFFTKQKRFNCFPKDLMDWQGWRFENRVSKKIVATCVEPIRKEVDFLFSL